MRWTRDAIDSRSSGRTGFERQLILLPIRRDGVYHWLLLVFSKCQSTGEIAQQLQADIVTRLDIEPSAKPLPLGIWSSVSMTSSATGNFARQRSRRRWKSVGKDQLQPRRISPWAISKDYARRYIRRDGESWVLINEIPFIFEPVEVNSVLWSR